MSREGKENRSLQRTAGGKRSGRLPPDFFTRIVQHRGRPAQAAALSSPPLSVLLVSYNVPPIEQQPIALYPSSRPPPLKPVSLSPSPSSLPPLEVPETPPPTPRSDSGAAMSTSPLLGTALRPVVVGDSLPIIVEDVPSVEESNTELHPVTEAPTELLPSLHPSPTSEEVFPGDEKEEVKEPWDIQYDDSEDEEEQGEVRAATPVLDEEERQVLKAKGWGRGMLTPFVGKRSGRLKKTKARLQRIGLLVYDVYVMVFHNRHSPLWWITMLPPNAGPNFIFISLHELTFPHAEQHIIR